jgi:AraC-like DNA-binding protein
MENAVYNMELKQFLALFADERQIALGEDFCMVDVRYDKNLQRFQTPARLDAYMLIFCMGGSVRMSVNMKSFVIQKGQMALFIPGYIGQVVDYDGDNREDIHYVILGLSRRFLSLLNLDLNRLFSEGLMFLDHPRVTLNEEEQLIATRYLQLASTILDSSLTNRRECLASLISSIFYLSEGIYNRQLAVAKEDSALASSRADDIFNRFLKLLTEYHMRERNVGFYADKLYLSPKYFSKLIKQASGRSAPDWIDSYVILEAKNFLKYSDMSIKEIVYRLHFSDQPTFTKFFKAHTGLTPVQFRKS